MIATQRWLDANKALYAPGAFDGVDASRDSLVRDVRSRVYEIFSHRAGMEICAAQVSYLDCLRSRLGDYDLSRVPAVQEWQDAYGEMYNAAKEA